MTRSHIFSLPVITSGDSGANLQTGLLMLISIGMKPPLPQRDSCPKPLSTEDASDRERITYFEYKGQSVSSVTTVERETVRSEQSSLRFERPERSRFSLR